jgi:hypothetical protein
MTPGPLLAAVVDTVTGEDGSGLAGCSDDQLMGIISAAGRPRPDGVRHLDPGLAQELLVRGQDWITDGYRGPDRGRVVRAYGEGPCRSIPG